MHSTLVRIGPDPDRTVKMLNAKSELMLTIRIRVGLADSDRTVRITLKQCIEVQTMHYLGDPDTYRPCLALETVSLDMEVEAARTEEQEEREEKGEHEGENGEEGDEGEAEEDEEEGEGEDRFELKFGDGTDPIDLVQGAHDGVELYHRFERLEYEALAERKRKALQDQHQFPDRYVKQRVVTFCISSLGVSEKRENPCCFLLIWVSFVLYGLSWRRLKGTFFFLLSCGFSTFHGLVLPTPGMTSELDGA